MRFDSLSKKAFFIACASLFSAFAIVGCASLPNERTGTERVTDAAVGTVSSIVTGTHLGSSGGSKYNTKLDVTILGGFSCVMISPSMLKIEVVDAKTGEPVILGLAIQKDWHGVGDVKLTKGEYRFILSDQSSRVFSEKQYKYSGEPVWKLSLQVSCK